METGGIVPRTTSEHCIFFIHWKNHKTVSSPVSLGLKFDLIGTNYAGKDQRTRALCKRLIGSKAGICSQCLVLYGYEKGCSARAQSFAAGDILGS